MAFSVTGTITIADVRDGAPGAPGAPANFYKNVYLYAQGTSAPTAPSNTAGFNSSTGEASAVTGWSTTISSVTQGNTIWIADARLVQTGGTGSWSNDSGWSVNAAGYSSADGSDAPRFAERKLYTNPAVSTAPSAPSATITWSTGALSSITSGWSETPPTQVATSADTIYESTLVFIDTTPPFSTTTVTGTSPRVGVNFSGLVTFDSGAFAVDGSTITNIDGGNIQTGTVTANELTINIRGDIGAGTGNGNGNSNLTNANVAIGGTQITSGTVATGRLPSEAINKNDQYNLVDPRNWDVGTDAGDGFGRTYSFNENDGAANERIVGEDAFGTESIIWQTIPDAGNDADGGWNCDFEIYKTTDALLYVNYVKRITTQTSGSYYLGCHGGSTLNLSGTANTNPYFVAAGVSELPLNVWCAVVGVIYGSSSTKTTNDPIGGVYRLDTGQKIRSTTSYRMKTGVTLQRHRAYLYYSSDNATRLQFCKPGVYVVNGSEPTLGQILGPVAAINNSSNTIDGSSITSNTITANQLVNNIRVDIGAGTGNGNGNGNGNSNLTNANVSINAAKVTDFTSTVQTTNINGGYINTGVVAGGNLSINSTNFEPNAGQGFALGTSGGTGRLVVGDLAQHLWWDGTRLRVQGEFTQVSPEILAASQPGISDFTAVTASSSLTGLAAGLYVCVLVGGGAGGATKNNNRNENNSIRAPGGGAGGMCIFSFEYDGVTSLQYNHGSGGAGRTSHAQAGGAGGASQLVLGGTVIAQANGGTNNYTNGGVGGTGVVNIANNNALSSYANTNTNKGGTRTNSASSSTGGAGVVIPTMEAYDANYTARAEQNANSATSSGGAMSYNFSSGNGTLNTTTITNVGAQPKIFASPTGQPGYGVGVNGTGSVVAGSGGIFAGGGGADGYWDARGGNGGVGGGGGGARTSHNDHTPISGSGGPGILYYRKA